MLVKTELASSLFMSLIKSGRSDQFFVQNLWYYSLMRGNLEHSFSVLQNYGTGKTPGGMLLCVLTTNLLTDAIEPQAPSGKRKVADESLPMLLELAIQCNMVPKDTTVANLHKALREFSQNWSQKALEKVERSPLVFEYPNLIEARSQMPRESLVRDDWWGPWVYFQNGLQ